MPNDMPMNVGYNPYSVQNLWAPMASQIDAQTQNQIDQLTEQYGAQGGRWSDALMRQMNAANLGAAGQKNQLFSQLMYDEANNAYGRQRDAAQMAMQQQGMGWDQQMQLWNAMNSQDLNRAQMLMQLGGVQSDRDRSIYQDLWSMGSDEYGFDQAGRDRAYNEWLRQYMGPLEAVMGAVGGGGGYSSDWTQDPGFLEKWGPILAGLLT